MARRIQSDLVRLLEHPFFEHLYLAFEPNDTQHRFRNYRYYLYNIDSEVLEFGANTQDELVEYLDYLLDLDEEYGGHLKI